jgi:dihydrofolate reductase
MAASVLYMSMSLDGFIAAPNDGPTNPGGDGFMRLHDYPRVTYVLDGIASAMTKAKAAAGSRNVMVHGAYTAQRALEAGVLDELQIHQIPVLLARGRRLFDVLPSRIELDVVRVIDTPEATHIRYRVRR